MSRLRSVVAIATAAALLGAPSRVLASHPSEVAPPTGLDPLLLGGLLATVVTAVLGVTLTVVGSRRRAATATEPVEVTAARADRSTRPATARRTRVHASDDPIVAALGLPGENEGGRGPRREGRLPRDAG